MNSDTTVFKKISSAKVAIQNFLSKKKKIIYLYKIYIVLYE